ncbi:E3 ubiquitin-protein ligase Midline-1-like [Bufo bufo]|uniref:E3 ubiquitin-protein ligase Midline-1-like n=1 Tax=Bufo bufo TaxID=8384 RepID=UPI001ABED920|nr:E3 ubiquitin-protein ligase Midline-1-like [Bufo bufo]
MAYMFLKKEIICTLCSDIYKKPVMLHCGHNFCSRCIKIHISKQDSHVLYPCPECKNIFKTKAPLTINTKLQSIAQNWRSVENRHSLGDVMCTYCLDYPSPAVKVCLHCESSLCDKHLEVHSRSQEHPLVDITASSQTIVCSFHGEMLKFFCTDDKCLICMSCFLTGSHQGHPVQLLSVASRHKREELQKLAEHMYTELDALKRRENHLQEILNENTEKVEAGKNEVQQICYALLNYLEDVMRKITAEIKHKKMEISREISHKLSSLREKEKDLSKKIQKVEQMCNEDDPVLVLQDKTFEKSELEMKHQGGQLLTNADFDLPLISLKLTKSLINFTKFAKTLWSTHCFHLKHKAKILLNNSTASDYLRVQPDRKSVIYNSLKSKERPTLGQFSTRYIVSASGTPLRKCKVEPPNPGQFKTSLVLSESAFSSGKHYWQVLSSKSGVKSIGVAYNSIKKDGPEAFIGYNKKSWCLTWSHRYIEVCHDSRCLQIPSVGSTMCSVGVYLDYDVGRLSFYRISPIQHLYTFTSNFTEPLHAAFYVVNTWLKIIC